MLKIYDEALEVIREVAPMASEILSKDAELGDQLKRAVTIVPIEIADGAAAIGSARTHHYVTAMAAAREALTCLEVAAAWQYVPEVPVVTKEKLRRVIYTLHNIVR